ncbi:unnamed protein product [Trifolium pratense]|uniref:Uncharacterized protein n=1 Tax=Trifolium pratense TaxID=57577 RepID=A0ACB0LSE9_TRIPR|nr:unnamed protein product [Trifolium pratense]
MSSIQCTNGHIICASCKPKCMKVACDNEPYGCKEVVKHTQRHAHIKSCVFSPCLCPQTDCNFRANTTVLGEHFKTNHQLRVPPFTYDEVFSAFIHIKDDVTIFQAMNDGQLFVITCKTHYIVKKLNLYHIGPNKSKPRYSFEMLVLCQDRVLQLKSEAVNVEDRAYPPSGALYVRYDYFKDGRLSMKIRINKNDDAESGTDL